MLLRVVGSCCAKFDPVKLLTRANGSSIVGHQPPTLIDVTCCVRFHDLFHVVGRYCAKFKRVKFLAVQTKATTPNNTASVCTRFSVKQDVKTSLGENVYVPLILVFRVGLISPPFYQLL